MRSSDWKMMALSKRTALCLNLSPCLAEFASESTSQMQSSSTRSQPDQLLLAMTLKKKVKGIPSSLNSQQSCCITQLFFLSCRTNKPRRSPLLPWKTSTFTKKVDNTSSRLKTNQWPSFSVVITLWHDFRLSLSIVHSVVWKSHRQASNFWIGPGKSWLLDWS